MTQIDMLSFFGDAKVWFDSGEKYATFVANEFAD